MDEFDSNATKYSRREWITKVPAGLAFLYSIPALAGTKMFSKKSQNVYPDFPEQNPEMVKEMVTVSHFDFERVKALVNNTPALAKASWDWGFGDWETGLEGASHMGRSDIAEYLIEKGAWPNIFTYAMLGELDIVKGIIKASPGIQKTLGPHGITLLKHAEKGGQKAEPVLDYLKSLGDADMEEKDLVLSEDEKKVYLGKYKIDGSSSGILEIKINKKGAVVISKNGNTPHIIKSIGGSEFAPAGAPAVKIKFSVSNGQATSFTVFDPDTIIVAEKIF